MHFLSLFPFLIKSTPVAVMEKTRMRGKYNRDLFLLVPIPLTVTTAHIINEDVLLPRNPSSMMEQALYSKAIYSTNHKS